MLDCGCPGKRPGQFPLDLAEDQDCYELQPVLSLLCSRNRESMLVAQSQAVIPHDVDLSPFRLGKISPLQSGPGVFLTLLAWFFLLIVAATAHQGQLALGLGLLTIVATSSLTPRSHNVLAEPASLSTT
jgi:hypothetical protein